MYIYINMYVCIYVYIYKFVNIACYFEISISIAIFHAISMFCCPTAGGDPLPWPPWSPGKVGS